MALLSLGCEDVRVITDAGSPSSDAGADGGDGGDAGEVISCEFDEDCVAEEPCLVGACVDEICEWSRAEVSLRAAASITPRGEVADLALKDGRLLVAEGEAGVESWLVAGQLDEPSQLLDRPLGEDVIGEGEEAETIPDGPFLSVSAEQNRVYVTEPDRVARVIDADTGESLGRWRAADEAKALLPDGDLLIVSNYSKGLAVMRNSLWGNPERIARLETPGRAMFTVRADRVLVVADGLGGAAVVNWTGQRREPTLAEPRVETMGRVDGVAASPKLAVLNEGGAGLGFITLVPEIARAATLLFDDPVLGVGLVTPSLAVMINAKGLWLYDARDPEAPLELVKLEVDEAQGDLEAPPADLAAQEGVVAVATEAQTIQLFELLCDDAPAYEEDDL